MNNKKLSAEELAALRDWAERHWTHLEFEQIFGHIAALEAENEKLRAVVTAVRAMIGAHGCQCDHDLAVYEALKGVAELDAGHSPTCRSRQQECDCHPPKKCDCGVEK